MTMARLTSALLALVALVSLACRAQPIPMAARMGTSFTVALVGEEDPVDWPIGFGSTAYESHGITEDEQRGRLVFYLVRDGGGDPIELETQLVTRVFPDPASEAGIRGGSFELLGMELGMGFGQVIAVVRVPVFDPWEDMVGAYWLQAKRVVGTTEQVLGYSEPFELLGPRDEALCGMPPFSWLPDCQETTIGVKWGGQWGDAAITQLYPYPKVLVNVPFSLGVQAAHFTVSFLTANTILVRDVFEEQGYGRRSIVSFTPTTVGEGAAQYTTSVTIDVVSLGPEITRLAIAYEPKGSYERRAEGEIGTYFSVVDTPENPVELWNIDGVEVDYPGAITLGPIR